MTKLTYAILFSLLAAPASISLALAAEDHDEPGGHMDPPAEDCFTNADLRGGYGSSVEIILPDGTRAFEVGRLFADGAGAATIEAVVSAPGGLKATEPATCEYVVEHSGMGKMDCMAEGRPSTIRFVLANAGKEIRFLSTGDPEQLMVGTGRRQ